MHQLSIGVAIILLVCYAAYIAYSVFGVHAFRDDLLTSSAFISGDEVRAPHNPVHASALAGETATQRRKASAGPLATLATWWRTTLWLPIVVLASVAAVTAVVSEVLVSTIEPLTREIKGKYHQTSRQPVNRISCHARFADQWMMIQVSHRP